MSSVLGIRRFVVVSELPQQSHLHSRIIIIILPLSILGSKGYIFLYRQQRILVSQTELQSFPYFDSHFGRRRKVVFQKLHIAGVGYEVVGVESNRALGLCNQPAVYQSYTYAQSAKGVFEKHCNRDVCIVQIKDDVIVGDYTLKISRSKKASFTEKFTKTLGGL